jgi:hypothetical protein
MNGLIACPVLCCAKKERTVALLLLAHVRQHV